MPINRSLFAALSIALSNTALAGEPDLAAAPSGDFDILRYLNVGNFSYIGTFGMDFKNTAGDLDTHTFQMSTVIGQPIRLGEGWQFVPSISYESMLMTTSGALPSILINDPDLHEIDLSLVFLRIRPDTRWMYAAWLNPALATDFQGISGDDFFLDAAAGVGYRFSNQLSAGFGVAGLNLTGDASIIPGPGFVWEPDDHTLIALYGPVFRATREMSDKWRLGFEFRPNGGIWNLDTALGSMNLDYTNFRTGITSAHHLAGDLWLTLAGGMTLGGSINVTTTDGSRIFQNQLDDLKSGYYGSISLSLKAW